MLHKTVDSLLLFFCSCFVSLKNVQGFRQPKKIIRIGIKKENFVSPQEKLIQFRLSEIIEITKKNKNPPIQQICFKIVK